MAGQAGYSYKISVSTTSGGTYYEVPSPNGTFNRTSDVLDDTDTTNAGYHSRLIGLLDSACSIESNWSASDTALSTIETSYEGRSELWVKVLPNGVASAGNKFPVVVENYNLSLDVTGLVSLSVSFQGMGAVVADDA